MKIKKTTRGFTLIEMMISITILMIFFGIVSRSYISVVASNKGAQEAQRVYADVRNILNTIGDDIRNGEIDYSFCRNSSCEDTLPIVEKAGSYRTIYKFDASAKQILSQKQMRSIVNEETIWLPEDSSFLSLTSQANPVDNFRFSVFPNENPYEMKNASNDLIQFQPSVTIKLLIKGYEFRTTYSSRTYGKKSLYL